MYVLIFLSLSLALSFCLSQNKIKFDIFQYVGAILFKMMAPLSLVMCIITHMRGEWNMYSKFPSIRETLMSFHVIAHLTLVQRKTC